MKIEEVAQAELNTFHGKFTIRALKSENMDAIVLDKGSKDDDSCPIVRIQSSCLFGETFGSTDCDCRWQIHHSLDKIQHSGAGIFIYLFQEGRGVGLTDKIRLYKTEQEFNCNTVEAFERLGFDEPDLRHYDIGPEIVKFLGYDCCKLLTNNPEKVSAFADFGLKVESQEMLNEPSDFKELLNSIGSANPDNLFQYLKTKRNLFSHNIDTAKVSRAIRERNRSNRNGAVETTDKDGEQN